MPTSKLKAGKRLMSKRKGDLKKKLDRMVKSARRRVARKKSKII